MIGDASYLESQADLKSRVADLDDDEAEELMNGLKQAFADAF